VFIWAFQRPGRRHLDFAGSGLWPAAELLAAAPGSLAGGACLFARVRPQLLVDAQTMGRGPLKQEAKRRGAGEQGRRPPDRYWAVGSDPARASCWCFRRERGGSQPSSPPFALAHRTGPFQLFAACWPAPWPGHGLGDGAVAVGAGKWIGRRIRSGCSFASAVACFSASPSLPSGRPWL